MASINTLLDDLLYRIFRSLSSDLTVIEGHITFQTISPLNILMVCESWHTIVESSPSLWNNITIQRVHDWTPFSPGILQIFASWLNKSLSSPLEITLYISENSIDGDNLGELLLLISTHFHRLRSMNISLYDDTDVHVDDRSPIIFECPPFAENFFLGYENARAMAILNFTSTAPHAYSHLTTMQLLDDVAWRLPPLGTLSFPNLVGLHVPINSRHPAVDVYLLLAACSKIVGLNLEVLLDVSQYSPAIEDPIKFTRILDIKIKSRHIDTVTPIIDWLTCPTLRDFIVQGQSTFDPELLNSFTRFFVRSQSQTHLTTLSLIFDAATPTDQAARNILSDALRKVLRATRDVLKLVLIGFVIDPRLVREMTLPPVGDADEDGLRISEKAPVADVVCPKVQVLEIACYDDEAFNVRLKDVEDMIESRWKPVRTLRWIRFGVRGASRIEEHSARLRVFRDDGLQFFHGYSGVSQEEMQAQIGNISAWI